MKIFIILLLPFSMNLYSKTDIALIKMLRGDVQIKSGDGSLSKAKKGTWLDQGQTIVTGKKSFARLVFKDKTSSNVGANSQLEIKSFKKGKAGILNLIKGQIRTKVVKDTLNQDKSKLFIKTKTAAMGVRGTDFHVSIGTNDKTTVLTYHGAVSMIQFKNAFRNLSGANLDRILSRRSAVLVTQGRFSSTSHSKQKVNLPVKIAPVQLAKLKDNFQLQESTKQYANNKVDSTKSITPPGISAKVAFNSQNSQASDAFFTPPTGTATGPDPSLVNESKLSDFQTPPPEGMDNGEQHAPAAGGFIDLASGQYVEPPKGAMFDPNTETFVVPKNFGEVDTRTGEFLPPSPESFQTESDRLPSSNDSIGFVGEHKFVPPPPKSENVAGTDQFGPNDPNGLQGESLGPDGAPLPEDFFDENIGNLDPCLVDINTCQDFNAPPPNDVDQPAFLKFVPNFPNG